MIVFSILEDTMKRPKTSKIVVYPIVEDTIHGLLWVHNRFLCAPSCPIAYTLFWARAHATTWTTNVTLWFLNLLFLLYWTSCTIMDALLAISRTRCEWSWIHAGTRIDGRKVLDCT